MSPDGRTKRNAADSSDETEPHKTGRAESWQAGPSQEVRNANYTRDIHKRTDARRTGLKTTTDHASWREVYRACHVGVGMNE